MLETTTEYLEQHSTSNEEEYEAELDMDLDEEGNPEEYFYVSFRMSTSGRIECDILWPENVPTEVVAPAVASLLVQINNGYLSDLCLETIASSCENIDDAMVNSAIVSNWHLLNENHGANASVDPEKVFDINRVDGE